VHNAEPVAAESNTRPKPHDSLDSRTPPEAMPAGAVNPTDAP